jgi:hypothetical protein
MNLSWSLLALALIGPDDQQPSTPKSPSSPLTVEVEIDGPFAPFGTKPWCPAATNATATTGSCPKYVPALVGSGTLPMNLPKMAAPRAQKRNEVEDHERWPMTLRDAIGIALDSTDHVHVIIPDDGGLPLGGFVPTSTPAAPIVISRVNPEVDACRFKAEVLALVRSVEQQYWNLVLAHAWLKCADQTVKRAREVLVCEEAELSVGRGTIADVAEASQRLEQFTLDWVTRTSDVITTERQLRNLLGLPPTDNRRIIAVTSPVEADTELDWETCFREMSEQQPELVQKKLALGSVPPSVVERGRANRIKFVLSPAQRHHEKDQQTELHQLIRQKTQTLAGMMLAVDTGYEQYQIAKVLREAAARRWDAQRSDYEEGRITVPRFLDAISQHAAAVAAESECLATYNIALAALAEAKGTLLADDGIVIADLAVSPAGSTRTPTGKAVDDHQAKTASFEPEKAQGMVVPRIETSRDCPVAAEARDACCQIKTETARTEASAQPKTWTFSISIGGAKPLQIKGTITAAGADQPAPAGH